VDTELSLVVGPVPPHETLRRLREASEWVPDGCDLGPWTWGFQHMKPLAQPFPDQQWESLEAAWLSPSATSYRWADDDNPLVDWNTMPPEHVSLDQIAETIEQSGFQPPIDSYSVGVTTRSWNTHPPGSLVVAAATHPGDRFLLIDVPPLG
jgi:hypothetical protein